MSLRARALWGLRWQTGAVVLRTVLQLVFTAALSRILTQDEFGQAALAIAAVGFAGVVADSGLASALVQREDVRVGHTTAAFWFSILAALLTSALVYFFAGPLSRYFGSPNLVPLIQLAAATPVLLALGQVSISLLSRELRFDTLTITDVVSFTVSNAAIAIPLALLGFGATAVVGALLVQTGLKSVWVFLLKRHPVFVRFTRREARELFSFGGGQIAGRIFTYLGGSLDFLAIGRILGAGAVGIYDRVVRLVEVPNRQVGNILDSVMFPVLSRRQEHPGTLSRAYLTLQGAVSSLLLPMAAMGIVLAPELIHLVLGPGWDAAVMPFRVLLVSLPFRGSGRMSDALIRSTGKMGRFGVAKGFFACAVLAGSVLGSRWGIVGVTWGVAAAMAAYAVVAELISWMLLRFRLDELVRARLAGTSTSLYLAFPTATVAAFLRLYSAPDWVVALGATAVATGVLLSIVYWRPIWLGRGTRSTLGLLAEFVPETSSIARLLRRAAGNSGVER